MCHVGGGLSARGIRALGEVPFVLVFVNEPNPCLRMKIQWLKKNNGKFFEQLGRRVRLVEQFVLRTNFLTDFKTIIIRIFLNMS